jgi:subtilisin family serine protease
MLFATAVGVLFVAPTVGQVLAGTIGANNNLHVIVFAGQDSQALNTIVKKMKDLGSDNVKKLQLIDAASGIVSSSTYQTLSRMPEVMMITEDHQRQLDPSPEGVGEGTPPPGKSYAVDPYVEPEALSITHADWGQSLGYTGQGIKIGFVDSGVDYKHPDLAAAIGGYVDTTGTGLKDEDGHGTGTASMVGAQGYYVYNSIIRQYMQVKGMAPDAKIYEAKVFDKSVGWDSNIIAGIEWAVEAPQSVNILSCSVGTFDLLSSGNDALSLAMQKAVEAGVTVFIAAGNEGPGQGTVASPATAQGVISVGASTFYREFSQEGFLMPVNGEWKNSQVIEWSSRPPTADGRMNPDIMSPGAFDWALAPTYYLGSSGAKGVQEFGGTSQATPIAAGCTALLMSAYMKMHPNTILPGPAYWESLLRSTATNLGYPGYDQTSGLIDVSAALKVLMNKPGFTLDANEWSVEKTGTPSLTVSVTATDSGTTQSISVMPTEFVPIQGRTIHWDDKMIASSGYSSTHTLDTAKDIPAGADFIQVDTIWSEGGPDVSFRNAVYDSDGAFITYGPTYGGYGHLAQCLISLTGPDPPAVTAAPWKVTVFPRGGMAPTSDTIVKTRVMFFDEVNGGWVDSSVSTISLPPKTTDTFKLTLNSNAPSEPGSYFGQVRVSNGLGQVATIPVVLTVPVKITTDTGGTFSGRLVGSTVEYIGGELYYYDFGVPVGTKNILVNVNWLHQGNVIWTYLVSPDGVVVDINGAGNDLSAWTDTGGLGVFDTSALGEELIWSDPMPGTWMVGIFGGGFRGAEFTEEFTGQILLNTLLVTPGTLDFTGMKAGQSMSADLTVLNTKGLSAIEVFGMASNGQKPVYTNAVAKGTLSPSHSSAEDYYAIPIMPNTQILEFSLTWAAGSSPISLNLFDPTFSAAGSSVEPEFGTQGDGFASVTITDPMPGLWNVFVNYYGTDNFHPVTYYLKISKLAPAPCNWVSLTATPQSPLAIVAGGSGKITVTVTAPSDMKAGQTLSGVIYLNSVSGDRLGQIPITLKT